jgi:hypothetical protein
MRLKAFPAALRDFATNDLLSQGPTFLTHELPPRKPGIRHLLWATTLQKLRDDDGRNHAKQPGE